MLDNSEAAMAKIQFRETSNIWYTRLKTMTIKAKIQHNMCWTPLCASYHSEDIVYCNEIKLMASPTY